LNRRDAEIFINDSLCVCGVSALKNKMAEIEDKLPDNTRGKFYVDNQCIDCDVCRDTAPKNFTRNDENGYSFVYKQPETPEELELCEEALNACPVEAIGDDGN
jgi:ferredoxin